MYWRAVYNQLVHGTKLTERQRRALRLVLKSQITTITRSVERKMLQEQFKPILKRGCARLE